MDAFPAFIPLEGARVVIVGEGEAADAKARLFDGSPADLVRIATAASGEAFAGARLVFVALDDEAKAAEVAALARGCGALVNVVDRPALGDFATPSIVDRGRVVGAVGTGGSAPVLAVRLRQEIEARWPPGLGALARLFETMRGPARETLATMDLRRRFFRTLASGEAADHALAGEPAAADASARAALAAFATTPVRRGRLGLIVAAPLTASLTLGAARRLGEADRLVILGDPPADLLAFARRDAPRARGASCEALEVWLAAGDEVIALAETTELGAESLAAWSPLGAVRLA